MFLLFFLLFFVVENFRQKSLWGGGTPLVAESQNFALSVSTEYKGYDFYKGPFGNMEPVQINSIVKQGTVLGPVLNNCSLDENCAEGQGYITGTVEIKALEFVDDIADLTCGSEIQDATNSN